MRAYGFLHGSTPKAGHINFLPSGFLGGPSGLRERNWSNMGPAHSSSMSSVLCVFCDEGYVLPTEKKGDANSN